MKADFVADMVDLVSSRSARWRGATFYCISVERNPRSRVHWGGGVYRRNRLIILRLLRNS